jgi:hypothetical protein
MAGFGLAFEPTDHIAGSIPSKFHRRFALNAPDLIGHRCTLNVFMTSTLFGASMRVMSTPNLM